MAEICVTHGFRSHDGQNPPDARPCKWLPADMLVDIKIMYEVTCLACGPLQAGIYESIDAAAADRRDHIRSHASGSYG